MTTTHWSWVLAAVLVVACAPAVKDPPGEEPLGETTDRASLTDAGVDAPGSGSPDGSLDGGGGPDVPGGPGPGPSSGTPDGGNPAQEACVHQPPPSTTCFHGLGGVYADRACSGTSQCCAGKFISLSSGGCGSCACTDTTGRQGCIPASAGPKVCFPPFVGTQEPLPASVRTRMTNRSWRPGCPVGLDALAYLRVSHWGFDGKVKQGELVVAQSAAEKTLIALRRMYELQFPIERMQLVDDFNADDDASMAANNTSAFNCRLKTGKTDEYSKHSYGTAIDLNPLQNPYVRGATVLPPGGQAYVDRSQVKTGMIVQPGFAVSAFGAQGFTWGGTWVSPKDYQHFELP